MRLFVRLLVAGGMLLSVAVVGPVVAAADPTDGPSATVSDTPSDGASAGTSSGTSSDPSGSASASASSSPDGSRSPRPSSRLQAAAAPAFATTITAPKPKNPTVNVNTSAHSVTFTYEANRGVADGALDVEFNCRITGYQRGGGVQTCPKDGPTQQTDPHKTTGTRTFSLKPAAKPYVFTVWATYNDPTSPGTKFTSSKAPYTWRMYSVYAPGSYMPKDGASFNNPLSNRAKGRTNLTRMIRTINAMPGYREALRHGPCPALGRYGVPGLIRVSLYSMTDGTFAKAMDAASRRCVSVQILMNDHLNRHTDPAWRRMVDALGTRTRASNHHIRRSFAHLCHRACRGGGVLHTKMYVFDSRLPAPAQARNKITNTVFVGSSNMTSNASYVQWNDLYGAVHDPQLFATYNDYYAKMRLDNGYHRNQQYFRDDDGKFVTTFWPVTKGHDPEKAALRSIHCSGATGGSGIHGHTVVYINMHAWFGLRGLAFQRQVRKMYAHGCYIRILYSFMTKRVYHRLKAGTGGRMQVRRTIFGKGHSHTAGVYSHFKNIAVTGHVGSAKNTRVVWTGSNNFTPDGVNFDEVMMRIHGAGAFRQYRDHFNYMKKRKSSGTYASFTEPKGGGRAP